VKRPSGISSFTLIVVFVCLTLIGLALTPLLPVKLAPSQELPRLTVSYTMPGHSSRICEAEVTAPLESMLARVEGVRSIYSTSDNGSGSVTLSLDKHADMEMVRFEVSTMVRQLWSKLPEGVTYPQVRVKQSDSESARPFLVYTLNATTNAIAIQQYAEEYIKPQLDAIKGISKIELSGATPMEWRLEYDREMLGRLGIQVSDIQQAINQCLNREFLGICRLEKGEDEAEWIRLVAVSPLEIEKTFSLASIFVCSSAGGTKQLVPLSKLLTVHHVEGTPNQYFRINGLNSVYLSITAEESANQLKLGKAVKRTLSSLAGQLPAGYELHVSHDATEYIQEELQKVYFRSVLTVLILLLLMGVITRSVRYLCLIALSLFINVAVAVIFYYLFHLEIQLYSLAGITISLNLIIDNIIVMADHYKRERNLSVFLPISAATLTTMGALSIIFFMEEKIRLNLQDFAAVVIVNLLVSLVIALFLVPSLMEKLGMTQKAEKESAMHRSSQRRVVHATHFYGRMIGWMGHHRVAIAGLLVLCFGLPLFLLPEKVESEGTWSSAYNHTFGSTFYKSRMKPTVDKILGGTLRLFVQHVYEGSYFSNSGETTLQVAASLPNGSTMEQMDQTMRQMEIFLSEFKEIKQFQTEISDARHASMVIYFPKKHQHSGFPYELKDAIIRKAVALGGGSWTVFGLEDMGFSNDVRESAGSYRIKMFGYNYDELYRLAEQLRANLLAHSRIREVFICSEFSWWKDDYREFVLTPNKEKMAQEGVAVSQLFETLRTLFGRDLSCGTIATPQGTEKIVLTSIQSKNYEVWNLLHQPCVMNGKGYKLSDWVTVEKREVPQKVVKENQQYKLCLQYEYIGSMEAGQRLTHREIDDFQQLLPMGYTVASDEFQWRWGEDEKSQYGLLFLIVVILFFITSILFNSLKQPLAILFIVPISYIGVFLTFYLFHLNFDQGGFASFVLLCGITVNASIYLLNEYNCIRKRQPHLSPISAYTKAWNTKFYPILLTVVSTVLGFVPFLIGADKEAFWFPLAAGTIGGLLTSWLGVFLFLPLFLPRSHSSAPSKS
jgi:multidrug efflux pump subunit AcrB